MLRLMERSFESGIGHHQRDPVRVYAEDPVQKERIKLARGIVEELLQRFKSTNIEARPMRILELGCGTGDISGLFAKECTVKGIDCAAQQIEEARKRFPQGMWLLGPAEYFASGKWDVVIMCEFLEHTVDPKKLVEQWLPNAEYAVISHPIDEAKDSQLSGGDHCWSFSQEDFENWFKLGGHVLQSFQTFQMGAYSISLGWSRRKKKGENGQ